VVKDQKTGEALNVTATLKQIRIVQTQATTLPSKEDQATRRPRLKRRTPA
jgi:hypothetical protein